MKIMERRPIRLPGSALLVATTLLLGACTDAGEPATASDQPVAAATSTAQRPGAPRDEQSNSADGQLQAPATGSDWSGAVSYPEPIQLDEDDVERFISAAAELKALNLSYQETEVADHTAVQTWVSGLARDAAAMNVLQRHKFESAQAFSNVAMSIMMARAALEMEGQQADFADARSQLAAMKDQLPPETYRMMEEQMLGAFKIFDDQPQGNLELARKYASKIELL